MTLAWLRNLAGPHLFACGGIQRQEIPVCGAAHYLAVLNGGAALGNERLVVPRLPFGTPDHLAARAVERHGVMRGRGVEDAVIHDWRSLPGHLLREAVAAGLSE